ncbi:MULTISPECIES: copper resistance CopC family protein [unclassified Mycolicibacterium]|uniref:copper resistance CopC family protein n=1 Tax=unclassified Mycolicibacterium TaxID=2636767 RepID=UPI0012DC97A8|nr:MULTISPECIES: copper resistance CopC family protein [unclassified Mycolicibacterium]MUL83192.1 copper resistance protein CopC [Mycolicibacterium sp. CBMA 329]MUL89527.1 copper resistance protein CopC [Mycolicibacterium sp. CBMA 331]MUM02717.1 copper resistance protein CopC [Mycolicibacterium sp. CBMA 334]MUM27363.1 copper resistance protein CopC [Mycolicibacterium sp. CBMA 295]MUM39043.1 copper resistance protein CopC [Mycolicibacterium sp. CBMA 247]
MSRLTATVLTGLILAASALVGAPAASAHAARVAADPAEHSTLSTSPQRVTATFNEALQPAFANMTVVGPDNNLWSEGDPKVAGAVISVGVRPLGPAGTYTVNYRVTSADGHVVSGSWSFDLTVAGSGTPGPAASSPAQSDGGIVVWPFVLVAVALIGGGAWWAVRRQR